MLRTVEQTASAVLNMFPDLELAVEVRPTHAPPTSTATATATARALAPAPAPPLPLASLSLTLSLPLSPCQEGEPALAVAFFNMVRGWVVELRALVHSTQVRAQPPRQPSP